jgi:hypothetical protein
MAFPLAPIEASYHVARKAGTWTAKMPDSFASNQKQKPNFYKLGFYVYNVSFNHL